MFFALFCLIASAWAATLPGLPLDFEMGPEGRWLLPAELPKAFQDAGVQPGWALSAVDGHRFDDPTATAKRVASGPARLIQLHFATPEGEVVVQVPRAPLISVDEIGLLPAPPDASLVGMRWEQGGGGQPLLVTQEGAAFLLDPATGGWSAARPSGLSADLPDVFWALANVPWAITRDGRLQLVDPDVARVDLKGAVRLRSFQGASAEHLVLPSADGLLVMRVSFPVGTAELPLCAPDFPETCLVAGRQIARDLRGVRGAQEEAQRMLGVACQGGVYRACLEAVALEDADLADRAQSCIERNVNACHELSRARLRKEPEVPGPLMVGVLEYACAVDASGSLGERLRRIEDVGEGCMLLSAAFDQRGVHDRALLSLDQACVLGRADACEESKRRREEAFALRTVQECESVELPLASACVQLGQLLQLRPIGATELDDFAAFLRGCELGDEKGCVLLGDYVDRWGIEHPRVVKAEQTLGAACKQGEQRACIGAAHLLVRHEPRTEAYGEALALFASACDAGLASGCIAGAEQRRIGMARKVEAPEAIAMWKTACDLASAPGCLGLGERLVRSKKSWDETFDAWTRACDTGEAHACTQLGRFVVNKHDPAWPGEQEPDSYLDRGCENGDAEGCYWLAEDEVPKKGDPPEPAYILLERSCDGDFGKACASLADVHLGRKTSFDDEIAAGHLQSACDNADFESCKQLGTMYVKGKGVEKDRVRAKELLQKYSINATRRHLRLGIHIGFPYVAGGEAELVAPIPVGPAISVAGSYSYLPGLGGAFMQLKGDTAPQDPPDLVYADAGIRLYPNNKARGLYGMVAAHWMEASGGELAAPLTRVGPSARLGIHNENKLFYSRVEMGIGSYGMIYLVDFDEDETGSFPLIQATLGFSMGFAPF